MQFHISGSIPPQEAEETIEAATLKQAVHKYKQQHPQARIEEINDEEVVGLCEGCGVPIREYTDQGYSFSPEDSIVLCANCAPSL
jgi:hypothetical protein